MSVQALIVRVQTRPHPKADRLQIGLCSGYQVIIGKDVQDGTLGIYMPPNSQLGEEFCFHNNLFREGKGSNKDPKKNGYLEANRRVKTIKLRGVASEGVWLELDSLAFTGVDISTLQEGQLINDLGGFSICQKYFTPATLRAMSREQGKSKPKTHVLTFAEHYDTKQLRHYVTKLPEALFNVIVTEKLHGTSGRTSNALVEMPQVGWRGWWNQHFGRWFTFKPIREWRVVTGTRRTLLASTIPQAGKQDTWHQGNFRQEVHDRIKAAGLRKGESVYYEIVGWEGVSLSTIMATHSVKPDGDELQKELARQYGDRITYSYGCAPGQYKEFVYRMTYTNEDGETIELAWDQMVERCERLGLAVVPVLMKTQVVNRETLLDACKSLVSGPSELDSRHIREGVCIRIEHPGMFGEAFKWKSPEFTSLEGISAQDPNFVDAEDAA